MRKAFEKGTYVPGASIMTDKLGVPLIATATEMLNAAGQPAATGHGGVLTVQKAGDPLWQRARVVTHAIHFKNAAARRRALENLAKQGKTLASLKKAKLPIHAFSEARDLKMVPLYRGLDARLANLIRADMRRQEARRVA